MIWKYPVCLNVTFFDLLVFPQAEKAKENNNKPRKICDFVTKKQKSVTKKNIRFLLTYLKLSSNSTNTFLNKTLSSFTSQILDCSSVKILSKNFPSQFGTAVWGTTM